MRTALGLALVVMLGCSHDARPATQPGDLPPLPPPSGTPIGYLVDDATELKLRDDQLSQLRTIDAELSARLDVLDTQLRSKGSAPAASAPPAGGRHHGGRHGGGGRGGMGGMGGSSMGGGGAGGRSTGGGASGRNTGAGAGSAQPGAGRPGGADAANRATEERAADVREALERAFALFDPAQQQIAKRVLADRGVDLDAGRSSAAPAEAEPAEPDTGSGDN